MNAPNLSRSWWPSFLVAALIVCSHAGLAYAQRGQGFAQKVAPQPTPTSGFPGIFDTNMVGEGHLVADLPTTGVNLGITPNLTLGVYAFSALPVLSGQPSLLVRGRYRLYGNGKLTSILDLHTGYLGLRDADTRYGILPALFLWNTSWRLSERQELVFNAMALFLRITSQEKGNSASSQVTSAALSGVGVTYQFTVVRWLQLRATVLAIPLAVASADSAGAAVEVGELDDLNFRTAIARVLASFRLGNWLLEGGGYAGTGAPPSPWLSVSKNW